MAATTHDEVRFIDTTTSDGPQSLWARASGSRFFLPIMRDLDRAGFDALEVGAINIRKAVELGEDPWESFRLLRRAVEHTPFRMKRTTSSTPFDMHPEVVDEVFMRCLGRIGIDEMRISSEWNRLEDWRKVADRSLRNGMRPVINLIFSISPRHDDDYYERITADAVSLAPYRICLKDPSGLLTSERLRTLLPAIQSQLGDTPLELHAHCSTGLGPLNALAAVELGVSYVHTGIRPLADGTALPSVANVAHNVRAGGGQARIDDEIVASLEERLTFTARRDGLPLGAPAEYDVDHYRHQTPGGMMSHLRFQLRQLGIEHLLAEVLEETAVVRAELGYPIMVTPLSQFVGSQATINVITGERYADVTDQVIRMAQGFWGGSEAIEAMDPAVRRTILDRPRAAQLEQPADEITEEDLRRRFGRPGMSDEDLLTRICAREQDVARMRGGGAPPARTVAAGGSPVVRLIEALADPSRPRSVRISKAGELAVAISHRDARIAERAAGMRSTTT